MTKYGLIGYPLAHSFSAKFFNEKFEKESIDAAYLNFEIDNIDKIKDIVSLHPTLKGINVTIPYKEQVVSLLNKVSKAAKTIGAVNVIRVERVKNDSNHLLSGYNTDYIGFKNSIKPLINESHRKALILGTGGASKAVGYALTSLGIEWKYVSRNKSKVNFTYAELDKNILSDFTIIINASPVGTYPNIKEAPAIPYQHLTSNHLLYDLVYNPEVTLFLTKGKEQGTTIKNGAEMLTLQALAAWEIWNK